MAGKQYVKAELTKGESISKHGQNGAYAWFVMIICLCAAMAFVMVSKALTPTMAAMCEYFGMDTVWGGSMSSLFGMITAIIILPLGGLMTKFSAKWMAVVGLALIAIGAFAGGVVTEASLFFACRVVQGFGYGIMQAVGMTVVSRWFDESHRGLPMGIYSAYVGLGGFLINAVATPLMDNWNWQALYIFIGIWSVVSAVLIVVFVADWPAEGKLIEVKEGSDKKVSLLDTLKVPSIWLMCVVFLAMGVGQQGVGIFMAMILMDLGGLDAAGANAINGAISLGVVLCTVIGGAIYTAVSNKAKKQRGLLQFVLVIVGASTLFCLLTFVNDTATCWIFAMYFALFCTLYLPGYYTLSGEHAGSPAMASMGITIFMFGQFLGGMVGPILFGYVNTYMGGFAAANWVVLALGVVAAIAAFGIMVLDRKFIAKQEAAGEVQAE